MSLDLAALRTYFDDRILAVDPAYAFVDDIFGDDSVSDNYGDSNYKLWFGEIAQSKLSNTFTQVIPVTVQIYSEECRDNTGAFDLIYQKAVDIGEYVLDPKCLETVTTITDINLLSIIPSPTESNDNMVRINLTFEIRKDFKYC